MDMMEKLSLAGLVPVIKVEDDAVPLCRALSKGGLPVAEITFRTDAAEEAIRRVHEELPEVMLGAGTVLTKEQVDRAVAAGAAYIVSPGLNRPLLQGKGCADHSRLRQSQRYRSGAGGMLEDCQVLPGGGAGRHPDDQGHVRTLWRRDLPAYRRY